MKGIAFLALLLSSAQAFQIAPTRSRRIQSSSNVRSENQPARRSKLFAPRLNASSGDKLTAPSLPKWDPTNWTPKRLHNSPLFRSAAILAALSLAGLSSNTPLAKMSNEAGATVHLLSFGTWFGTVAYTTFVAGITMYKNLERKTFGKLQSKLFPKYFSLCSLTILLQMVTLRNLAFLGQRATTALGVALAMTLLNQFYLEPKSTDIMFKRYEIEDLPDGKESQDYKKLASDFGKFHGISSLTNLIALCGAVAHGYFLASALAKVAL